MDYHPLVNGIAFAFALYGSAWVGWCLFKPAHRFAQQVALEKEHREYWPLWRKASQHGHYWLAGIGLWILGWYAAGAFTDFVPPDWGMVDEDGEWTPVRQGLRGMIGLVLGIGVLVLAEGRAEEHVCRPLDRSAALAFLAALTDTRFKPGHLIRSAALRNLEATSRARYGEPSVVSEYREKYMRPLRRAVEADEQDQ